MSSNVDYSNLFVCLMGMCTVFIGLICIIVLVSVMSGIVRKTEKAMKASQPAPAQLPQQTSSGQQTAAPCQVTPSLVAAISAAIAEEMGTDVSAIRIISIKKV